jgi:pSer/pThr/pTyr-binding forkhead associated (FHA) protein
LRGLGADFANLTINLGPKGITMGRDPQRCNLVFPPAAEGVSKWHCVLRWDNGRRAFIVEDLGSMNGTFTGAGERIPTGKPRSLQPGEQFYVGNRRNLFEVGLA